MLISSLSSALKRFTEMMQKYNNLFSFTSTNTRSPDLAGSSIYTFRISIVNPNMITIVNQLDRSQQAQDRPDIIAHVFYVTFREVVHDLSRLQYQGFDISYIYSIEFQKRGLPHAHLTLMIAHTNRLPNQVAFRPPFQIETEESHSLYPTYHRLNNHSTICNTSTAHNNVVVSPYNYGLSLQYQKSIYFKPCFGILSIKYVYKYRIKKRARSIPVLDEVELYRNARYSF